MQLESGTKESLLKFSIPLSVINPVQSKNFIYMKYEDKISNIDSTLDEFNLKSFDLKKFS